MGFSLNHNTVNKKKRNRLSFSYNKDYNATIVYRTTRRFPTLIVCIRYRIKLFSPSYAFCTSSPVSIFLLHQTLYLILALSYSRSFQLSFLLCNSVSLVFHTRHPTSFNNTHSISERTKQTLRTLQSLNIYYLFFE